MTTAGVWALYEEHVASLSRRDQMLLASTILERLAGTEDLFAGEDPAEVGKRQREALKSVCGVLQGGDPEASVRHDEIL